MILSESTKGTQSWCLHCIFHSHELEGKALLSRFHQLTQSQPSIMCASPTHPDSVAGSLGTVLRVVMKVRFGRQHTQKIGKGENTNLSCSTTFRKTKQKLSVPGQAGACWIKTHKPKNFSHKREQTAWS